ncbi:hypothetical protein Emed_004185 [Eimeria media]
MLCVHSKKHLSADAAKLELQRTQNVRAMHALQQLLQDGGALVWVAPSGGRDRPDASGVFSKADRFDVKAIQSFCLLAKRAKETAGRESLFCPMALWTAPICPPPNVVKTELGEVRRCKYSPIGMALGGLLQADSLSSAQLTQKAQQETDALYASIFGGGNDARPPVLLSAARIHSGSKYAAAAARASSRRIAAPASALWQQLQICRSSSSPAAAAALQGVLLLQQVCCFSSDSECAAAVVAAARGFVLSAGAAAATMLGETAVAAAASVLQQQQQTASQQKPRVAATARARRQQQQKQQQQQQHQRAAAAAAAATRDV